jgi:hypothetical protein
MLFAGLNFLLTVISLPLQIYVYSVQIPVMEAVFLVFKPLMLIYK